MDTCPNKKETERLRQKTLKEERRALKWREAVRMKAQHLERDYKLRKIREQLQNHN